MKINLIYKVENNLFTWKLFFFFLIIILEVINFYYNHKIKKVN